MPRLTAFAQNGWGEDDLTADYPASERRWEIDRIGVLGLLKASINASLQDTPIERKIEVYRRENLLLRCLHPMFQQNNKPMRTFIQLYDLQGHLRPLGTGGLRTAVTLRAELYRRLCAAVWRLDRLGFPMDETAIESAPLRYRVWQQAEPVVGGVRSDRSGEFGKRRCDPHGGRDIQCDLVVMAS